MWAFEGLVSPSPAVSRESSRVLALLGYDVTSWEKIVHKLCGELNYLISVAYAPFTKPGELLRNVVMVLTYDIKFCDNNMMCCDVEMRI